MHDLLKLKVSTAFRPQRRKIPDLLMFSFLAYHNTYIMKPPRISNQIQYQVLQTINTHIWGGLWC